MLTKLSSMNRTIYFLVCIILATGCSRNASSPDKTKQIYERLHGKYNVVSSVSNEAVDVNLDGNATIDMLSEIPYLAYSDLEIRIVDKKVFLLAQFWPEQYIGADTEPTGYDPSLAVGYANQCATRTFSFDPAGNNIQVNADTEPKPDPRHFPFPTSVTTEGEGVVKIVFSKKLYTTAGWKNVVITTIYKRYTMET